MSRDVTLYVNDMIEACRRVVEYSEGIDRERLQGDSMRNDAIVRNLEILGEAAKAVPADVRALEPEIAWRRVAGLRDVLAHAYFAIDRDIVWNVVSTEVPALLPSIEQVAVRADDAKGGRPNSERLIRDLSTDLSPVLSDVARSAEVEARSWKSVPPRVPIPRFSNPQCAA